MSDSITAPCPECDGTGIVLGGTTCARCFGAREIFALPIDEDLA